jgi:hypothetical protein
MAGTQYQPPREDAADTETEETSGREHRGEWQRAAHDDAQRGPVHESLQKAHERVHGVRSDGAGSDDADQQADSTDG